jgi:hypothetical protein
MKSFIEQIQKSIFSPAYYREIVSRSASYSWKYYLSLALFLAVFMTIVSSVPLIPKINRVLAEIPPNVLLTYPDELAIEINKGHVSTNVTEPYFIAFPEVFNVQVSSSSVLQHLGVIDTKSPVTPENFTAYHTLFWLTGNSVVAQDQNSAIRITPLTSDVNLSLNKTSVRNFMDKVTPYFAFVAPFVALMIFLGMLLSFTVMLLYLLFSALLVLVMGKFMKKDWSYGTAYRICLHAITLPLFIDVALSLLPLQNTHLPFFTTFVLLVVVYMNFKEKVVPVVPNEAPNAI